MDGGSTTPGRSEDDELERLRRAYQVYYPFRGSPTGVRVPVRSRLPHP
jgi:hypothetical protein